MQGAVTFHLQPRRRVPPRFPVGLDFYRAPATVAQKNFDCFKLGSCKLDATRTASATHRFSGYLTPVYSPDMTQGVSLKTRTMGLYRLLDLRKKTVAHRPSKIATCGYFRIMGY